MKIIKRYKNVAIVALTYLLVEFLNRTTWLDWRFSSYTSAVLSGFMLGALPMLTSGRRKAWFCTWAIWIPMAGILFFIYGPELWVKNPGSQFIHYGRLEFFLFVVAFAIPMCFLSEGRLTRGRVLLVALPILTWVLLPFVPGSGDVNSPLFSIGRYEVTNLSWAVRLITPVVMGACLPRIELRIPKWAVLTISILMLIPYSVVLLSGINNTILKLNNDALDIARSTIFGSRSTIGSLSLFCGLLGVFIREFIEQATVSRRAKRLENADGAEHEARVEG